MPGEIRAALAISQDEALAGTSRTLILPGGQRISVSVPAGAYNGQVLHLFSQDSTSTSSEEATGTTLILTLTVLPVPDVPPQPDAELTEHTVHLPDASSQRPAAPEFPSLQWTMEPNLQLPPAPKNFVQALTSYPNLRPPTPSEFPPMEWTEEPGNSPANAADPSPFILYEPPPAQVPGVPAFYGNFPPVVHAPTPFFSNQSPDISQSVTGTRRNPIWKVILLTSLAILLIFCGLCFFSVNYIQQVVADSAHTTATALSRAAQTNATATQENLNTGLTATAQVTTSAFASNLDPYPPTGVLAFADPLNNSSTSHWVEDSNSYGGACHIKDGAYYVSQANNNHIENCLEGLNYGNFAFEVQMKMLQGDCGGIIFHADDQSRNSNFYLFDVCENGGYDLFNYMTSNGQNSKSLASGASSAMQVGYDQPNLLAVVVHGSTIDLYVNHVHIHSVHDSTHNYGLLGLVAVSYANYATSVAYNYARVWTL
jgi:eukaryotic-like serine/threonine-protein kinase